MKTELHFHHGTLVVPDMPAAYAHPALVRDERTGVHRAAGHAYGALVAAWEAAGLPFDDRARCWEPLPLVATAPLAPHPHQEEALASWTAAGHRGIVVLPTGAGKTWLAVLAMLEVRQATLIVVPTIDLMHQWRAVLQERLGVTAGALGGGEHSRAPVTVATYDSAALQAEFIGHRFGLLVCDECHHLPAASYQFIATAALAPARLGLTATLDRADGGERVAMELLGPCVYSASAAALGGTYLAPYEVRRIEVDMTADEQAAYDAERALYTGFLRRAGVRMSQPDGWTQFVVRASRSDEGRRAMRAYRAQRRMALTCSGKRTALWAIVQAHRHDRILIFTDDNETVYALSRTLLIPSITHQTKPGERRALLGAFAGGSLPCLVTSRVLNEGVDVPDANVGVVLSGSGSVREHVQRLGRLLRKRPGKAATLYEICSATGAERGISERRRRHEVYAGPGASC
ncbi:MAG TPA: DEAD/DEAH box helicase family protein [Myxococcota bacterium]|nr:DEAD/DEAH box helicase family protein [Myxococcota bacterium]